MQQPHRVGIVVGSRSDIAAAEKAAAVLDELGVSNETRVISAHRAPDLLARWVASADERGIGVVIAIAGLAAHLPGVVASQTTAARDRRPDGGRRIGRPRCAARDRPDAEGRAGRDGRRRQRRERRPPRGGDPRRRRPCAPRPARGPARGAGRRIAADPANEGL